ncbi:hypothetical protein ACIQBJ_32180 [Kitasatospora sp. NPDC088391]|uniref:hypothetical protein n=1 Tax=Kitasatospora sp. NPDC088391 TaxID=3364074 RepID=UPI00380458F9
MASVRRPAVLFAATALFGSLAAGSAAGHESAPDRPDRVRDCRQEEPTASCPQPTAAAPTATAPPPAAVPTLRPLRTLARSGEGGGGDGGGDTANGVLVSLGSVLLLTGSAAAVLRHGRRVRP